MAERSKCPPPGAPAWLATFADLMSLLLCFFVLLLSMASMDLAKFKAAAGSMKEAFGVQRELVLDQIPMGNSVIEQHFSPGEPTPTPLDEIRQSSEGQVEQLDQNADILERARQKLVEDKLNEIEEQADKIRQALAEEIEQGVISVERKGFKIVMRIRERGSFDSASAVLQPGFEPVMAKITASVAESQGKIVVAGHTDDVPIKTSVYRSNWELSSSRAVTVAHRMMDEKKIDPGRFLIEGHADTHPLVPNDTQQNRAINRRVEIAIVQDDPIAALAKRAQPGASDHQSVQP